LLEPEGNLSLGTTIMPPLLIRAGYLLTLTPQNHIYHSGNLLLQDGRVAAIGEFLLRDGSLTMLDYRATCDSLSCPARTTRTRTEFGKHIRRSTWLM